MVIYWSAGVCPSLKDLDSMGSNPHFCLVQDLIVLPLQDFFRFLGVNSLMITLNSDFPMPLNLGSEHIEIIWGNYLVESIWGKIISVLNMCRIFPCRYSLTILYDNYLHSIYFVEVYKQSRDYLKHVGGYA